VSRHRRVCVIDRRRINDARVPVGTSSNGSTGSEDSTKIYTAQIAPVPGKAQRQSANVTGSRRRFFNHVTVRVTGGQLGMMRPLADQIRASLKIRRLCMRGMRLSVHHVDMSSSTVFRECTGCSLDEMSTTNHLTVNPLQYKGT